MKEVVPDVTRVGFLNNMSNPVIPPQWEETQRAARSLAMQTELLDVRSEEDIPRAFDKAAHSRVDGLLVGIDAVTQQHRGLIVSLVSVSKPKLARRIQDLLHFSGRNFPLDSTCGIIHTYT